MSESEFINITTTFIVLGLLLILLALWCMCLYEKLNTTTKLLDKRINLLMDHLNLEIKESEPAETKLVKKKPIKKSK